MSKAKLLALFLLLLPYSLAHAATTIDDLIRQNELQVSIEVVNDRPVIVGQEVTIKLRIATSTWFKGSVTFTLPEIDNAIVIQRSNFGLNSSEHLNGKRWTVHEKEFSIFPQQATNYMVPEFEVSMKIHVIGQGDIEGIILTNPIVFSALVPKQLQNSLDENSQWWAANHLAIKQAWDKDLTQLLPGDAVTRTITIEADGLLAMMLPEINHNTIHGLPHYLSTPELIDNNNRGNKLATRIQKFTYIVEQQGKVVIPKIKLAWWDNNAQTLKHAQLDSQPIAIGSLTVGQQFQLYITKNLTIFFYLLCALCLLIGYLVFIRKRTNNSNQDKHRTKKIKAQLKQAIKSNDHKSFIKWAYIYLDTVTKSNNINLLTKELSREENSATSSLFESVFSPVSSDKQTDRLSKSYLKALNKNSKVITKPKTPNITPKG